MIFLKLGGSLITEKSEPETSRDEVIERCAVEIEAYCSRNPEMQLILGHGSGSFGHYQAAKHQTQLGAKSSAQWRGFTEVWASANRLNRIVIDTLRAAGLPAIAFPPSSFLVSERGEIILSFLEPVEHALRSGLIPVVYGDVAFDRVRGSSIVSTEKVLEILGSNLPFTRILLAGREPGVLSSYPAGALLSEIDQSSLSELQLTGSASEDVTGGMASKVEHALALSRRFPEAEVRIFSGESGGDIRAALQGDPLGTLVRYRFDLG